jgi:hypothetical protein
MTEKQVGRIEFLLWVIIAELAIAHDYTVLAVIACFNLALVWVPDLIVIFHKWRKNDN